MRRDSGVDGMHSLRGLKVPGFSVCILLTSEPPDSSVSSVRLGVCTVITPFDYIHDHADDLLYFGEKTLWRGLGPGKCKTTMRPQDSCVKCQSVTIAPLFNLTPLCTTKQIHPAIDDRILRLSRSPEHSIDKSGCSSALPCDRLKQWLPPNP